MKHSGDLNLKQINFEFLLPLAKKKNYLNFSGDQTRKKKLRKKVSYRHDHMTAARPKKKWIEF